jgi:hypothetical protein
MCRNYSTLHFIFSLAKFEISSQVGYLGHQSSFDFFYITEWSRDVS